MIKQIDEVISEKLNEIPTSAQLKMKGEGNGCIIKDEHGQKKLVYIAAHLHNNKQMRYSLVEAWIDGSQQQVLNRTPLYLCTQTTALNAQQNVEAVTIKMKANEQISGLFAIHIKEHKSNNVAVEHLALLKIIENEKLLPLLKVMVEDRKISDFSWHPYSPYTLLILSEEQNLSVWSINDGVSVPTDTLNLKKIKKRAGVFTEDFTAFAFSPKSFNPTISHYFSLHLLTANGEICSLFPFCPTLLTLPYTVSNIYDLAKPFPILNALLDTCQLNEQAQFTTTIEAEQIQQEMLSIYEWKQYGKNQSNPNKHLRFYSINLYEVEGCWISLKVGLDQIRKISLIKIELIMDEFNPEDKQNDYELKFNWVYPVTILELGEQVLPITIVNQRIGDGLLFLENNSVYRLNMEALSSYIRTQQISELRKSTAFEIDCIVRFALNESIHSVTFDSGMLTIIRAGKTKQKFEMLPLQSLSFFDEIHSLNVASEELMNRIKQKRIFSVKKDGVLNFTRVKDINLASDTKQQQNQQAIKIVKKNYEQYCDSLRNKVDREMSELKGLYEKLKNQMKKFTVHDEKKKKISDLMNKVRENNNKISEMVNIQSRKRGKNNPELLQFSEEIDSLQKLIEAFSTKKLEIDAKIENEARKTIVNLKERLFQAQEKAKKAEEMKKYL